MCNIMLKITISGKISILQYALECQYHSMLYKVKIKFTIKCRDAITTKYRHYNMLCNVNISMPHIIPILQYARGCQYCSETLNIFQHESEQSQG